MPRFLLGGSKHGESHGEYDDGGNHDGDVDDEEEDDDGYDDCSWRWLAPARCINEGKTKRTSQNDE